MENNSSIYCRWSVNNIFFFIESMFFSSISMEDLTEPELIRTNPLANRTVCLYGYVRGCPIKADTPIHIPGR